MGAGRATVRSARERRARRVREGKREDTHRRHDERGAPDGRVRSVGVGSARSVIWGCQSDSKSVEVSMCYVYISMIYREEKGTFKNVKALKAPPSRKYPIILYSLGFIYILTAMRLTISALLTALVSATTLTLQSFDVKKYPKAVCKCVVPPVEVLSKGSKISRTPLRPTSPPHTPLAVTVQLQECTSENHPPRVQRGLYS